MAHGTQSIDRAAELLSLVIHATEPVTYTSLVETTGLARSTVSRLLAALERNGLLERDLDGAFRGGAMFTHYAARYDRVEALLAVAQPYLERIGERTGETVNLGVPRGEHVVHVAQIDSRYVVGATSWMDVDVPPHCSALGKVMYAFGAIILPGGSLAQCTPQTVTDRDKLLRQLEEVRERGYATTSGDFEEGLDAVAAPVHGPDGVVNAAIGVSGPSFRLTEQLQELGEQLVVETGRLASTLKRLG
ncbi:MAG TPA: IclR family transcriptional regulator [Segeticoccus sp.]|jgi:DNA-binding IclR family transcriptional regulator|nr:IclR family transcriptional regulator [Segeticoccus sp.]